ncbi:general transcription factor 3C polypeptide 5-like [Salvia splendens]|uniref:general transcription factor 3C polypeptide 5-like n=1 Tax=Salvia splendens TaxID=180675 RepID=UPI001C274750|nr:general transcription factor 3C polypeptide 5-like [Salvia splendens]XP_042003093.1 general transcription factor 3C polypeptide 5-like [Salvia splendens]XP_042003095.1 general transcription factor 3C polypeptide 5-like [Salvia splendens]XP_042003096.1 general transcription factor 3C polypeptide 5-like [Salvia splendens]XP_042003097.1 general transcription factor 3C polypeptide 5-like [Salvia splendens]XP_042003098.1 general transcription factor 3C polypeptide 5-like [Salvia splendens]XP_04
MGVIEDGSISGVLPSGREAFVVHYPGYPSSVDRAIETLGGMQQILKARAEKPNKLELYFRPEDPYSHPVSGELRPCTKFLLKFSKKKLKDTKNVMNHFGHTSADPLHRNEDILISQTTDNTENIAQLNCESLLGSSEAKSQINNGPQEQLCADVVARVSEEYHFNGMVDYQHVLAVHANATRRKKRNFTDMEPESGDPVDVDQDDFMILVPPLFSLKSQPQKMILKPSGELSLPKRQDTVVRKHSELEIDQCFAIDFNIKEIPKKVDWEKSIARDSDLWKWQTIVCELFDERPVWVKHSLAEHLLDRGVNVSERVLKRLLFLTAYYFSNGPFMRFWIRKGYDPRKDPESRIYQRTDFRVPPPIRNYCDTNLMSGLKCRWKDICDFRVFPRKAQILLQFFELDDDYIQQEIRKPASHEICTLQTGWFTSQILDILRLRVALRFLSVYPETGAQSLLRSVTNRFERLKILHLTMKDKKAKEADKDVLETKDKETNDEVEVEVEDEDDEEDEMEDENLGEDVDIDEVLDMADPDRDFFLPDIHIENDNISKDYLQDLFGSFPFGSAGGNEMQDDPYDEEYQIYDQDSDGNLSNDED